MSGSHTLVATAVTGLTFLCTPLLGAQHFYSPIAPPSANTQPDGNPPTLGNYPDTSLPLSINTTVTPDAAPTNTTRIDVSTSTNFIGTFAADPATGVVRIIDARPAGTY